MAMIRLLCLGDVVGEAGVYALENGGMKRLREKYKPDIVVVNAENAAEGNGLSAKSANRIYDCGADILTGGNHVWKRRDLYPLLDDGEIVIRPANYPAEAPGMGYVIVNTGTASILVINLAGCAFMEPVASPFETIDRILRREEGRYDLAVCDFHAETTSEKLALARYCDGRLAAIWGTHTHVATADIQILPGGTGYITDLGMCGSHDGILGVKTKSVLHKYLMKTPVVFEPAEGNVQLHGALFVLDPQTHCCTSAEAIYMQID